MRWVGAVCNGRREPARAWKARLPVGVVGNALGRCGLQWQKGTCPRLESAPTGNRMGTSGSPVGSALGKRAYRE